MMDFPNTPTVGTTFSSGNYNWIWDGQKWNSSATATPVTQFLPLAGGTLTGPLVLFGNATANLNPVTLQQFNAGFANYLALSGGTLTGPLVLSGNATANLNPVPLQQLNSILAGYLPVSGGTISGNVQINGTILSTSTGASGQFRMTANNNSSQYGAFWRNDGVTTYFLLTNNNDALGTWNGLRPFAVDDATGNISIGTSLEITGTNDNQSTVFSNFTKNRWRFAINAGDDGASATIDYRGYDGNALGIVGAGAAPNRGIHMWDNVYVDGNFASQYGRLTTNGLAITGSTTARTLTAYNGANFSGNWCQMFDDGNGHIESNTLLWLNGNTGNGVNVGGNLWASGGISAPGELYSTHSLATAGYVWINGVQWTNNSGYMYTGSSILSGGNLCVSGNTGMYWQNNGGYMYCPNSVKVGDFISSGNVNSAGVIYVGGLVIQNNAGWVYSGSPINSGSDIAANGALRCGGTGGPAWYNSGGLMHTDSGCYVGDFQSGGNVNLTNRGTIWAGPISCYGINSNSVVANGDVEMYGHTYGSSDGGNYCGLGGHAWAACDSYAYNTPSARELKTDIVDAPSVLDKVMALRVVNFRWRAGLGMVDPNRLHHGFIADEVADALGRDFGGYYDRIVTVPAQDLSEDWNAFRVPDHVAVEQVDKTEMVAVLWKAVQELVNRVATLEGELKAAKN